MRGVFKRKGYWVAKYGTEYLGNFKNKSEAENERKKLETIYGIPTKSHPKEDLTGKTFGNLKVIGYTGISSKGKVRQVIVRNLLTNSISEIYSRSLKNQKGHGKKRWENSSKIYGVYKRKDTGKWKAEITFNHKKHYLGSFPTKTEAIAARKKAEKYILKIKGDR